MTTATISRLERRVGAVLGGDDGMGDEWRQIRERVLLALVDHPGPRLEVELLPLDAKWRYGVFAALADHEDAKAAVVAMLEKIRDEAGKA